MLAVFALYATRTLMLNPGLIGVVFAIGGIGGMVGAALAGRLAHRWSRGRVVVAFAGACGGLLFLAAPRLGAGAIVALSLFLYNAGESAFGVTMQTCRQEATPAALMGRMDTTMRVCFRGMASLGALTGGLIAFRLGARVCIGLGVAGLLLTVVGIRISGLRSGQSDQNGSLTEFESKFRSVPGFAYR